MEIDNNNDGKRADDLFEEVVARLERLKRYPEGLQLEFAARLINAIKTRARRPINEVQYQFERGKVAGAEVVPLRIEELESIVDCGDKFSGS